MAQLPREDAARLARELLFIDQWLEGPQARQTWPERLTQFVRDYDGTEAALLTQVDVLMSDPRQMLKQIGDLDQFAKDHPRTNAAAKALFHEGFQLHVNVPITGVEPRGSDPTERLLRVAAIVKDLESARNSGFLFTSQHRLDSFIFRTVLQNIKRLHLSPGLFLAYS
jgi:hypothetical protein